MRYIVVSGGVVSGLGKGVSSASMGVLLQACGLRVSYIKIDPYLNFDSGLMSPAQHGEAYVLSDKGEVDLDLGNAERFLGVTLTSEHSITTGKIYTRVMQAERRGEMLGKTVQVVPHVTNCIQNWIKRAAAIPTDGSGKAPDVCIVEIGGTVGDLESSVYLEALRQLRFRVGAAHLVWMHVTYVPVVHKGGQQKTKPTQHGAERLRSAGITPDYILCRAAQPVCREAIAKISMFCMINPANVISMHDVANLYHVPQVMFEQKLLHSVLASFNLHRMPPEKITTWNKLACSIDALRTSVRIALVGKYTDAPDTYLSVMKSLLHAGLALGTKVEVVSIDASALEAPAPLLGNANPLDGTLFSTSGGDDKASTAASESKESVGSVDATTLAEHKEAWRKLSSCSGVLVPGGFSKRGTEGMIAAIGHARTKLAPFLGICLGMQCAVIEYARNVAKLQGANSTEFDKQTKEPVVFEMPDVDQVNLGGTMRLGLHACHVKRGSLAHTLYGLDNKQQQTNADEKEKKKDVSVIEERHRHRFEVNPLYTKQLTELGLVFSGHDSSAKRMEIIELARKTHPFFVASQFHPEFLSRPLKPAPLFVGFVRAALVQQQQQQQQEQQKKEKKDEVVVVVTEQPQQQESKQ
jgi:CTP synthase